MAVLRRIGEAVGVGADRQVLESENAGRVVAEGAVAVVSDRRTQSAGGVTGIAGDDVVRRGAHRRNHADRRAAVLVDRAASHRGGRHRLRRHVERQAHRRRVADVAVAVLRRIGETVGVGADRQVLEPGNAGRVVAEGAVAVVGDRRTQSAGGERRVARNVVVRREAHRRHHADRRGDVLVDRAAGHRGRRHRLGRHVERDVDRRRVADVAVAVLRRIGEAVGVGADQHVLEPRDRARVVGERAVGVVGDRRTQRAGGERRVAGDVVVRREAHRRHHADRRAAVLVDRAAGHRGRRHRLRSDRYRDRQRRGRHVAVTVRDRVAERLGVRPKRKGFDGRDAVRVVRVAAVGSHHQRAAKRARQRTRRRHMQCRLIVRAGDGVIRQHAMGSGDRQRRVVSNRVGVGNRRHRFRSDRHGDRQRRDRHVAVTVGNRVTERLGVRPERKVFNARDAVRVVAVATVRSHHQRAAERARQRTGGRHMQRIVRVTGVVRQHTMGGGDRQRRVVAHRVGVGNRRHRLRWDGHIEVDRRDRARSPVVAHRVGEAVVIRVVDQTRPDPHDCARIVVVAAVSVVRQFRARHQCNIVGARREIHDDVPAVLLAAAIGRIGVLAAYADLAAVEGVIARAAVEDVLAVAAIQRVVAVAAGLLLGNVNRLAAAHVELG